MPRPCSLPVKHMYNLNADATQQAHRTYGEWGIYVCFTGLPILGGAFPCIGHG